MNALALPAHLQRYQSRDLGATLSQNLGANAPPYVSIAGGRFTLIDAAGNDQPVGTFDQQMGVYIDACIIDVNDHISRVYYEKDYDPSAQTFSPPDCWSDNGVGPSTACSNPQSPTCASCQWAVWGSAISAQGKAIPACQQVQKCALLVPSHPQGVFLLRVPPNSHKNLRSYNELSKRSGIDISNVITRIYFDRTTQGTLLFSGVTWIDEVIAQAREAAYAEKKTDTIVGRNDVARPALPGTVQPMVTHTPPAAAQITQQPQQQVFQPGTPQNQVSNTFGQQVQQPGPFPAQGAAPQTMMQTTDQGTPTSRNPSASSTIQNTAAPAGIAPGASPSNGAPQRRRRRTSAEVQAANAAPQGAQPQPATAPFPHSAAAGALPGQTDMGFSMSAGQPASGNPEVAAALDSFFQN
jgi:hypothetical protein